MECSEIRRAYQDIANEVMGNINLWDDESAKS